MGNFECKFSLGGDDSEVEFDMDFGKDWAGVCEVHHCHVDHNKNHNMSYHDKFMRECFSNMYLMNFKQFFKILTDIG